MDLGVGKPVQASDWDDWSLVLACLSGSYVPVAETLCCFVCLLLHEARRIFFRGKCTFECLKQMIPDINDVITETTQTNWQEPRLLRPTGLGAWLKFYVPATSSRRKFRTPDTKRKKLDTKTISDNLVLNHSFNAAGHLCWRELNELFGYPPRGRESDVLNEGYSSWSKIDITGYRPVSS